MNKATKNNIQTALIVLPFLLLATVMNRFPPDLNSQVIRGSIHIGLLIAWGISIHTRIIQIQVRRYLLGIVGLMALWLTLKTVKHSIYYNDLQRILWYLYYIPMLFIPLFALFVSMSLGKNENYRLPMWTKLLYVPTVLLFILVLTNDFHQAVFSFPTGIKTDKCYSYETGYYIVLGWIIICALSSILVMLKKCRILHNKVVRYLPFIPLCLSLAYTISYIHGVKWVLFIAGDMTVTHCFLIYCVFEICMECGLIQSNLGYEELLAATTIPVQITDDNFISKHFSSAMDVSLQQNELVKITADSITLDENTLLKRNKLKGGWVFWKEDISELNKLNRELELTREELRETGDVLAAENEQQERFLRLTEENRLYDMMASQTAKQITMLKDRLNEIKKTDDEETAKKLLGQVVVIGTYIKRRNNLIFVGSQRGAISAQELRLCLNESAENLNLYGIMCKTVINGDGLLSTEQAALIYDVFEAICEAGEGCLDSLLVSIETEDKIEANFCFSSSKNLSELQKDFKNIKWEQDEDGLQYIILTAESEEEKTYGQNQRKL